MTCTSLNSRSLPAVVVGRSGMAERQLISLEGLPERLDGLLTHELARRSTIPATLGGLLIRYHVNSHQYCKAGLLQFFCGIPKSKQRRLGS